MNRGQKKWQNSKLSIADEQNPKVTSLRNKKKNNLVDPSTAN